MQQKLQARPHGWKFNIGLLAAGLEALSAVALLATSAYLISRASEQPPILYLMMAVVGVRAFALGRAAFRYLQRLMLHDAVFTHLAQLRPVFFERLVQLTPTGFQGSRGERLNRLTADVDELQNLGLRILAPVLQAFVATAVSFLILLGFFPATAALAMILSVLALGTVLLLTRSAARVAEADRAKLREALRSTLVEYLESIELLESLGWQQRYRERIRGLGAQLRNAERSAALTSGLAASLMGLFAIVVVASGAVFAPAALESGTPANLLAVAVLLPLAVFDVYSGFQLATQAWEQYRQSKQRLDVLFESRAGAELDLVDGPRRLQDFSQIQLQDARLELAGNVVHESISLSFQKGQVVAITGASGAGKTTVALALASLIRPTRGELRLDGVPAESFGLDSLRSKVLLIEQDPHVFAGTVRQNLEISGSTDPDAMESVLREVGLWEEFVHRGGLDCELSEAAANISGGQAQRLAIARGLLVGAEFLILDEPTSGLDWTNAQLLIELLHKLAKLGHGVLIITHDGQLAESCDHIIRIG